MTNPLSKYRIFKNIVPREATDDEYEKYRDHIVNMDIDTNIYSTHDQYLHYYLNVFRKIYEGIDVLYGTNDLKLFMYIKERLTRFYDFNGYGRSLMRLFGFMCKIEGCDKPCDNSVCESHLNSYMNTRLLMTDYLFYFTTLNIPDVRNIVFDYYFRYTLE